MEVMIRKLCECEKCRLEVKPGKRFVRGHNNKKPKSKPEPKLCECNCGQYAKYGKRFIQGHNIRVKHPTINHKIREKISESHIGNKNPMFGRTGSKSPVFRRKKPESELKKLRDANIGKKNPKLSELNKKKTGHNNPFYKKNHTVATRKIMSKNHVDVNGKNNPNWHGGISAYPYGPEFNKELKEHIRNKFNHTCILCGKFATTPHHIDYDKNNNKEENFVLLCKSCNGKVNFNRDQWEIGFKIFIGGSKKMLKFFKILPISNI